MWGPPFWIGAGYNFDQTILRMVVRQRCFSFCRFHICFDVSRLKRQSEADPSRIQSRQRNPGQVEDGEAYRKEPCERRRAPARRPSALRPAQALSTSRGVAIFPRYGLRFGPILGWTGGDLASVEFTALRHPSPSLTPGSHLLGGANYCGRAPSATSGYLFQASRRGPMVAMRLPRDWLCRLQRASVFERGCGS
jgi:hypothetical protein